MDGFVCAQDLREKELLEQGYVSPEKAFFRIGRAIFVVDVLTKDYSVNEALDTPLGLVSALNNPEREFDQEMLDFLQNAFGSTGFFRIVVEGDEDCGFASDTTILLTGYRAGLDDVIVDNKLLKTVHGSDEDIMRNFAEFLEWRSSWISVPRWETYEGLGYRIKHDESLKAEFVDVANKIRAIAEKFEHKDDMPEEVKERLRGSTPLKS